MGEDWATRGCYWLIAVLFALIVGGSFAGWFPSTVGGAVAVVAILAYAVLKRTPPGITWQGNHGGSR